MQAVYFSVKPSDFQNSAVVPSLHEIGEPDQTLRLDQRPVVERHPDQLKKRIGGEDEHEGEPAGAMYE